MGSNKKDLEIIYNLQWKSGNGTSHNDKSNIVGMYDIPATTLNWETFKSYLLKNSGAMVDDVKVSYVSSEDKEFPIESQLDFQIALYSFRQRARNNDVITLKLDRVCDKMLRIKRQRQQVEEPTPPPMDDIPNWFKNFMKEYKKEVVEEVTTSVVNAMSSVKLQALGRKLKETSTKRLRKSGENNDKEIRKTLKLERKIEELEEKTNKIKEKKLALARSGDSRNRPIGLPLSDSETLMDATPVGPAEINVSHLFGGEIYRQEWIITNTGSLTWTSETELRYAWGSEALKPIETRVACPLLKPGEKGPVVVYLEVPSVAGEYECYWHFCQNGRRFGHWLGCHVNVDASPIKLLSVHRFDPVDKSIIVEPPSAVSWSSQSVESQKSTLVESDAKVTAVSATLDELTLVSDSDNQSVVSVADSNSSAHSAHSDEFVVVPIKTEPEPDVESVTTKQTSGYAYINIDGKKQAVPKMFLRKDFLENAEEAVPPESETVEDPDNKRLFVFPLNCPGFEVVYPPNPMSDSLIATADSHKPAASEGLIKTETDMLQAGSRTALLENAEEEVKLNFVPTGSNPAFITAPSMYPNGTVPIFTSPLTIPPPPPLTIPVPPPRTIPVPPPPIYTYNTSNIPNSAWYYPTGPQFPPPNHNYAYPLLQSFVCSNNDPYCSQAPVAPHFEGGERPTSPINAPPQSANIIPETLVSGAVNVASSAINTARSVLNMFTSTPVPQAQPMPSPPQPAQEGSQVDSHLLRERAHRTLSDMGFWNYELNSVLLDQYHDDVRRVVNELIK